MLSRAVKIICALGALLSTTFCTSNQTAPVSDARAAWHNNQGVVYMDQHNYTRAQQEFLQALDLRPEYALAHTNLGIALYSLGRYDSAAVELAEALRLDPSLLPAHYTTGLIITAQGDNYERALPSLERVVAADPDDPNAHYYLGQIRAKLDRSEEAIGDFQRAIELDPYNVSAHYALANQYRRLGNTSAWQQTLARFSELTRAGHVGVSSSYQGQGRYAEAMLDNSGARSAGVDAAIPIRFAPPQALPGLQGNYHDASLADLDGDTRPDLVTLGEGIWCYLSANSDGALTADAAWSLTGAGAAKNLTCADWDGDGAPDLLLSGSGVSVIRGSDHGWTPVRQLQASGADAAVGDPDHDGDLDLAVMAASGVTLLYGDGSGELLAAPDPPLLGTSPEPLAVRFTDIDNDRDTDLLILGDSGVQILGNNRDGTFGPAVPVCTATGAATWADMLVEDVNNDALEDLTLVTMDGQLQVYTQTTGRLFDLAQSLGVPTPGARGLLSADLDYDGDTDVLVYGAGGIWLLPRRNGRLEPAVLLLQQIQTSDLQVMDWDGDRRLDLVADGMVLLNQTDVGGWLRITARGQGSNSYGLGARIEIRTTQLQQKRELSASSPVTFGLGSADSVEFVRVLWPSGVRQTELATRANQVLEITELDRKGTSCPVVYVWDGTEFRFVSDINGGGIVGYLVGPGEYYYPDTDEYLPLGQLAPLDGDFVVQFGNHLEEVIYADALELVVVDHPMGVEVFPNERLLSAPPYPPFQLFALTDAQTPQRVIDHRGKDVRDRLTEVDDDWYDGFRTTDIHGYAEEFSLEFELADRQAVPRPVLLAHGWVDYAHSTSNWAAAQRGWQLQPPQLQIADEEGGWRTVCADIGTPAGLPKQMLFDLSKVLPDSVGRFRIVTNTAVYWDQVLVANRVDVPLRVQRLKAHDADLHWRGYPEHTAIHGTFAFRYHYDRLQRQAPWSTHGGRYTQFGRVDELVKAVDDRYAIMFHGDEITLRFDASALQPLAPGMARDYLLYSDGFGKDMDHHSAHSLTVEPLPFHGMSMYPYPKGEEYPMTEEALEYLAGRNTRVVRGRY
jgi:hypothetical protein